MGLDRAQLDALREKMTAAGLRVGVRRFDPRFGWYTTVTAPRGGRYTVTQEHEARELIHFFGRAV